jgi:Secretion system C-terminal sorting domain
MKNGTASFMTIYPNPAPASATLYYQATQTITTRLEIYQYDGRLVQTIPLHIIRGANYINLDLEKLSAGLYFVSVGEYGERVKLVVQGK